MSIAIPNPTTPSERYEEFEACYDCPVYFINHWVKIFDAGKNDWVPFSLWDDQFDAVNQIEESNLVVMLKARQLGFTWVVLAYALWLVLFRPGSIVLLFSQRDNEAKELLVFRLKGMYERLPTWLQTKEMAGLSNNDHEWELANGSRVKAFPTTGGRSYTANLVIVDEADFVEKLQTLLNAVKPTIDMGGQLILLSTSDKSKPQSAFKNIYRQAKEGKNSYRPIFVPWHGAPWRTQEWYDQQKQDCQANTGSLDDLHQEYPATDEEALSPRSLDKRIPPAWVSQCYEQMEPIECPASHFPKPPALPGFKFYAVPIKNRAYGCGCDPAEGNPTSDESAAFWLDSQTGEEVASLIGKFDPDTFAEYIHLISEWFNKALILCERNNHGHSVISNLRRLNANLMHGHDGKTGWLTNTKGKPLLYVRAAEGFRDQATVIHDFGAVTQLQSIEANTLSAPDGEHDDRATAYALALMAFDKAEIPQASKNKSPLFRKNFKI